MLTKRQFSKDLFYISSNCRTFFLQSQSTYSETVFRAKAGGMCDTVNLLMRILTGWCQNITSISKSNSLSADDARSQQNEVATSISLPLLTRRN